jgi:hypothetical protein
MAKQYSNNPNLKRDEIKNVRDRVKANYKKGDKCEICDSTERLEFHHFTSLTALWNKWKRENNIVIKDTDDMLKYGDMFTDQYTFELLEDTVTLCHYHHAERLHKIYGKTPPLSTAKKQRNWVKIQREKFLKGDKV